MNQIIMWWAIITIALLVIEGIYWLYRAIVYIRAKILVWWIMRKYKKKNGTD